MINDKNIIDLGNVWLINGNRFNKAFCGDNIEIARQCAETLINCFGCVDCINCMNCKYCVGCNDCKDCEHCSNCNKCDKCSYCIGCTSCSGCESITGANRLKTQTIPQHNAPIPMNLLPMQQFSYR